MQLKKSGCNVAQALMWKLVNPGSIFRIHLSFGDAARSESNDKKTFYDDP